MREGGHVIKATQARQKKVAAFRSEVNPEACTMLQYWECKSSGMSGRSFLPVVSISREATSGRLISDPLKSPQASC